VLPARDSLYGSGVPSRRRMAARSGTRAMLVALGLLPKRPRRAWAIATRPRRARGNTTRPNAKVSKDLKYDHDPKAFKQLVHLPLTSPLPTSRLERCLGHRTRSSQSHTLYNSPACMRKPCIGASFVRGHRLRGQYRLNWLLHRSESAQEHLSRHRRQALS